MSSDLALLTVWWGDWVLTARSLRVPASFCYEAERRGNLPAHRRVLVRGQVVMDEPGPKVLVEALCEAVPGTEPHRVGRERDHHAGRWPAMDQARATRGKLCAVKLGSGVDGPDERRPRIFKGRLPIADTAWILTRI